jgi:hypothetical protein
VRNWCREFGNGWVSVADEQSNGRKFPSAKHVDIDAAVQAYRLVSLMQLE